MNSIELGRTGEKVPVLGLGTWKLGADPEQEIEALETGFKLGMFVDTAEMYGTEPLVGKALEGEKKVFVATKVSPDHFHHDDVIKACDRSLKGLNVKQIDLYQLHWPNTRIPIEETMGAMEELVKQGKIRYIGVSNFSVEEMKAAQAVMKRNEIVSNQVEYSILVRNIEKDVLDYCKKNKMTVIAYSPLVSGRMFNKKNENLLKLISEIGRKYGMSPAQIALAWVLSKENVVAIPRTGSKEHVIENAKSANVKLDKADIDRINSFL